MMKKQLSIVVLLFVGINTFAQVPNYVPTNGLVGYWPFNGNANDESGNGNNGTVNGATLTTDRFGNSNSAYQFSVSGSSNWGSAQQRIVVSNPTIPQVNSFTMSSWVKISAKPVPYNDRPHSIMSRWDGNGTAVFRYQLNNTSSYYAGETFLSSDLPRIISCPLTNFDEWHHHVITYDGSTLKQFIDGNLINEYAINIQIPYSNSDLTFGETHMSNGHWLFFNGKMDELCYWSRALTQQEITNLYTETAPVSCLPSYVPTNGLVGYWPFCGNANDESGNGNNGTVNGATLTTDRFGSANKAYSFDGVNDFINIPDNAALDLTDNFTISAWLNPNNFSIVNMILSKHDVNLGSNAGTYAMGLWQVSNNNLINFQAAPNYNPNTYPGITGSVQTNAWRNFVVTYVKSSGLLTYYLDNTPVFSTVITFTIQNTNQPLRIGANFNINTLVDLFSGSLDDIGIWNRALTQQEITNLYTSSVTLTCSVTSSASTVCSESPVSLQLQSNVPTSDTIIKPGNNSIPIIGSSFEYSGTNPASGWTTTSGGWNTGSLPYVGVNTGALPNSTFWPLGSTYYLRKTIDLTGYNLNTIQYFVAVDNGYSLYVNGTLVNSNNQGGPATEWEYTGTIPSNLLVNGINYIAFIITDDGAGAAVFNCMLKGQPNPATYSWSPGGATTPSITVSPNTTTTYTCTVTANGQSCSSSQTIEVLQPAITATTSAICSGQSTTLTASMPVNTACPTLNGTLTNGLVGYWPFCGNANDASGNGNNGTVNGATLTNDRFGNANSAYSFDGVDDFIQVDDNPIFQFQNQSTVSFWINYNLNSSYLYRYIIKKGLSGQNGQLYSRLNPDNKISHLQYDGSNYISTNSISVINNSTWYFITQSNDGQYLKTYINGIIVDSVQSGYALSNNNFPVFIGSDQNQGFYSGHLDDIGIWNRALSLSEIQQLYTQGQTTYSWSPGGATTPSITVSPTSSTTYTCTITANEQSCSSSQTITVNPLPTVNAGSDQTVCTGTSVTLSGSGANTYSWNNGVTNGVAFIPASTATYTLTGTNTSTGCTNTDQVVVTVNTLPTVNAGIDQTVCAGTSVTLSGSGANTYSWNNGVTNAVAFTPVSTATYTLTGTNTATGCTNTDQVVVTVNTLPTVNAGNDQAVCAGTSVTLSGSGANTYSWNNGVTNGVAFTPVSTATYTLTGTNTTTGCTNTDQVVVTVNALPTVNAGIDQTVCAGTSVTLSGSGANTYSWNNGVNNSVAFTPASTATYTLTGTNTATGCTNTDQVVVTVNTLPTVNAGNDQAVCAGTSVTLSGSGANTYSWNNGVTNGVAFTPASTATYTLTGTNTSTGCTNTDQVVVTVNALPTVNAGIDQTVCAGTSVILSGSGANTYSWNNGVTNAVAFTPVSTATYTLTGTNTTTGCTNTDQVVVTVNALPLVNGGADQSLCQGQSTTLFATGANSFSWSNNIVNGVGFLPTLSQEYIVTGTNTLTGCINSDTVSVTVNALPIVNAGADLTICKGDTILLSGSGALNYSWNNNVVNGQEFVPAVTQTYQVVGTDANNCSNNDEITVTVNEASASTLTETALDSYTLNGQTYTQSGTYTQVIPNAAGCDSTITLNLTLNFTGLNELQSAITIAPNPTMDFVTITSTDALYDNYVLFDPQGRKVLSGTLTGTTTQLDLSRLSRGNYLLQIGEKKTPIRLIKQ